MKILRVIASMDPVGGGPAQGLRNIIPELYDLGVINEVVCFDSGKEDYCGKDFFKIHYLGKGIGPFKFNLNLNIWLLKNFSRFDVVIIHGLWLYNSFGTLISWKIFSMKNISFPKLYVMPHGMLDPYFQKAKSRKFKSIRNSFFWHLFEKYVINGANGVLFTCQQELDLAKTTFIGYSPNSELNVSYGIQSPPVIENLSNKFHSFFPQLIGKDFILFLSRVHEKKGVDLLILAFLKLKEAYEWIPDLVIAGPGLDSEYGKELIKISGQEKKIHFLGMVKGDMKWSLLYKSDIFILPSHQENFGIAIVEALACGKPVLITNKVNIFKEIVSSEAGFAQDDTLEGVTNLLEIYLKLTESKKEDLNKKANKLFEQIFSIKQSARIFLNQVSN